MVAQKIINRQRTSFTAELIIFRKTSLNFLKETKSVFIIEMGSKSLVMSQHDAHVILFFLLLRQNDNSLSAEPANIEAP